VIEPGARRALVEAAEATIANPDLSDIFGPDALVEAPIAAVLANGVVVTGTVDRLLVSEEEIRLVDFKTGRSVPERPDDIPVPHLRQMAAYAAALEVIFPDRRVEALLLYTSGPLLHRLSPALLDRFRPEVSVDG
jgi:ATP-dependent helicase/nuclease subunit A